MNNEVAKTIKADGTKVFTYKDGSSVITVEVLPTPDEDGYVFGNVTSTVKITEDDLDESDSQYNAACEGIEALLLSLACSGVDISGENWHNGITDALNSCSNNL